ncbi:MAG: CapA family protein [Alphaproteobacteria bacterium]
MRLFSLITTLLVCWSYPTLCQTNEIVITFAGDVNFNRSGQKPEAKGARKAGFHTWTELSNKIEHLFDGDINFVNLETVVTDKNNLRPANKKFVFQSHPASLNHLQTLGVNLVSAANNHAYDYRWKGYNETHKHLKNSGVNFAGIGLRKDILQPTIFEHKGVKIAFNALSFLSDPYPASDTQVGILNLRNRKHWREVIKNLGQVKADIKILSLHQGIERQVTLEGGVRANFTKAVKDAGINLLLAHHPHVARGVERVSETSVIYYGLGNFLMLGARNMGPLPNAQDYGLFGKAYFQNKDDGLWTVAALEAHPITDMHLKPKPMKAKEGTVRLKLLNKLSRRTSKNQAVKFHISSSGVGLACFIKAESWPYISAEQTDTRSHRICSDKAKNVVIKPNYKPRWRQPAPITELPFGI